MDGEGDPVFGRKGCQFEGGIEMVLGVSWK